MNRERGHKMGWLGKHVGVVLAALATCCAGLSFELPVRAEGPAVSAPNGKITGFGGGVGMGDDKGGAGGFSGSLTVPLGYAYGMQIDAGYARIGDGNFGSTGAHLFWRDPGVGLLGVYAGYARLDRFGGQDLGRVGIEAQKFYGQFTLDSAVGFRFGSPGINDDVYGRARVQYYLTDNLMLMSGYTYEGRSFGTIGMEYQLASQANMGVAVFGEGQLHDNSNYAAIGGFKIFLGGDMSLKDRHRRQDPDSYFGVDMQATQLGASRSKPASGAPPQQACPFTPSSNLCGCVGDISPSILLKGGTKLASACPVSRKLQCQNAGYSPSSPGPTSCGCAAAFSCAPPA